MYFYYDKDIKRSSLSPLKMKIFFFFFLATQER
jgi:hypothetical protein